MNNDEIIEAFSKLASCGCTQELIRTMRELLCASFPSRELQVYELVPARIINEKQRSAVIYKNIDTLKIEGRIEEHNDYSNSYDSRIPVHCSVQGDNSEFVIPIVLSDLNVSHMLSLTHADGDDHSENSFVEKIMLVCSSLFKTLHEKNYDPLTRVLNRQAFDNACLDPEYFGSNNVGKDVRPYCAVAIIDIDFFKSINDRFGHAIGDEVLVLFCQLLSSVMRDEDKIFRYGGEEFVLFLRSDTLANAKRVLDRCRARVEENTFPQVGSVTMSAGFTKIVEGDHPHIHLLKADRALYYAKDNGRNSIFCYDELVSSDLIEAVSEQSTELELL